MLLCLLNQHSPQGPSQHLFLQPQISAAFTACPAAERTTEKQTQSKHRAAGTQAQWIQLQNTPIPKVQAHRTLRRAQKDGNDKLRE